MSQSSNPSPTEWCLSALEFLSAMPPQVGWWRPLFFIAMMSGGVMSNSEGDALDALKMSLIDIGNVLQSWDPTLRNPCLWFHVTCNINCTVVRLDLQSSGLSGTLVPQLGDLPNLQYLELSGNNFTGPIPKELGKLTALESLDLYQNSFTGNIPDSLGQLSSLRFLRLNNNSLNGSIPDSLTAIQGLQVLDLSYNNLTGDVPSNGSFSLFSPISFLGNHLCGPSVGKQCPGEPPLSTPPPYTPSQNVNGQQGMNLQESQIMDIIFLALIMLWLLC